MKILP